MSTIQAANISDGTDTVGTEYVINGSAKSWVNFDGTGTVSIRESFNASSITDNGTGNYTVNFDTALEDDNYCGLCNANEAPGGGDLNQWQGGAVSKTTSSFIVLVENIENGERRDAPFVNAAAFR